jgi:hypothetical protein
MNHCPKGDLSTIPNQQILSFCAEGLNSNADAVGRAVAGLATIWTWACRDGSPVIKGQFAPVDPRGFDASIWHVLTSDGTDRLVPTVAVTP